MSLPSLYFQQYISMRGLALRTAYMDDRGWDEPSYVFGERAVSHRTASHSRTAQTVSSHSCEALCSAEAKKVTHGTPAGGGR